VTRLTAVVPATDAPATLGRCLAAIEAADAGPDEVMVVRSAPGPGPAHARNEGARGGSGEVLVFVDADVVVHQDAFRRIRAHFDADSTLTAVFGSYDDRPEAAGAVSGFRNLLHHHVHQESAGEAGTFWAGLGAVRRDAFEAAAGFDVATPHWRAVEDVELGMRLIESGARIALDPELLGTHLKRWTLAGMVRTDLVNRGIPWVGLVMRNRRMPATLNLGARHRVTAACWLLALASRRPLFLAPVAILNRRFYALLWRRRGARQALLGFGLHGVHHLSGAASVPAGVAVYVKGTGLPRSAATMPTRSSTRMEAMTGTAASRPSGPSPTSLPHFSTRRTSQRRL
jgi:glycosyltransferase involved in cell wall biosynthesis